MGIFDLFKTDNNKGVFLSKEQIQRLEQRIELPVVYNSSLLLRNNEVAVYYSRATRQITKNRLVGRTSNYGGGSVRVTRGVSVHTGSSTSRSVYGDVTTHYAGELVITNERIVFVSNEKAFEIPHNKITAATVYKDALGVQSKNSSYLLLIPRPDLAVIAFDGVRIGNIPIAGRNNVSTYDTQADTEYAYEQVSLAKECMLRLTSTLDADEFFQTYKDLIIHQFNVTSYWIVEGDNEEREDSEKLLHSLMDDKESFVDGFLLRCGKAGVLRKQQESILRHANELSPKNQEFLQRLLDLERKYPNGIPV